MHSPNVHDIQSFHARTSSLKLFLPNDQIESKITTDYYSCKYTDADDQFAMVWCFKSLNFFALVERMKLTTVCVGFLDPYRFECR